MDDVAATGDCGVYIFCVPDIADDDFYVLGEERFSLGCADQHSNGVPTLAELIDEVSTEETGCSCDQRLSVACSFRIDGGPPLGRDVTDKGSRRV